MNDIMLGFQVMAYGLLGVFSVILLFYASIVAMVKFLPHDDEE